MSFDLAKMIRRDTTRRAGKETMVIPVHETVDNQYQWHKVQPILGKMRRSDRGQRAGVEMVPLHWETCSGPVVRRPDLCRLRHPGLVRMVGATLANY